VDLTPVPYQRPIDPSDPHTAMMLEKSAFSDDPVAILKKGYLQIKTKDGDLMPFKMNSSQRRIIDAIQKQRRQAIPVRIVILKSRQMGTSTLCEALIYAFCSLRGVSQGLVLADDEEGASDIFKMNETFYDGMSRQHPHLTPKKNRSDERRMEFLHTKSGIRIETANNKRAGRKYTYRYAHLTEVAFYPRFKELMAGLLPSIPDQPETILMLETTANGLGDFHQFWQEKKRLYEQGQTEWIPIFLPWKDHEEYVRPFIIESVKEQFVRTMTQEELAVMKFHQLTLEQMNWRRHQIQDVYNGDQDKFEVEYPLSDREAFKSTSRRVFPDRLTDPQAVHVQAVPKFRGELEMVGRRPSPMADPQGFLKIYKEVQPEWQYVIGADSCESALSHDEACAQVLARNTWQVVAHLHGHVAPDDLARKLFALGSYYNMALIAPERNGPGAVTVTKLAEMYYPNICRMAKSVITDGGKWVETEEFGFHTNVKTKPQIIDKLSSSLRDLLLVIYDKQTIDQLCTFVVHAATTNAQTGITMIQTGAEEGFKDDCVMALAIAVWYAHQTTITHQHREVARPSFMSQSRSGYG
jgi:hypothetical protein